MKISLAAACLVAGLATAQGPVIESNTRLVLVDTVVTDKKGNYLRDLAQKDFKVFEDNKEQTITSFSRESAATQDAARKHYTLLFFDDTSVKPALHSYAGGAARDLIGTNAGPGRLMAIAQYGDALKLTQNFTDDPERLKQALTGAQTGSGLSAKGNATTDYTIRGVLAALRSTVQGLAALSGRKTLIFVSGGYPPTSATVADITAIVEAANRANVAIYPVMSAVGQGLEMGGPNPPIAQDVTPDTSAYTQTRRGVRGEVPVDSTTSGVQQVLYSLASGTGGFPISTAGDAAGGFAKVGKEDEEYYILGYTPQSEPAPGKCHALKVKIDKSGEVRSRAEYCETKTQDLLSGTSTERDLEARLAAGATPTVAGASMQLPFFYAAADTATVHLSLEIPAGAIQASLNLIGIATLPDGTVKARFSDSVKRELSDKPFHYEKDFKIPSGAYDFKLVFSTGPGQFGRLNAPLTIEPWNPGKFAISGLAFSRSLGANAPQDAQPLRVGSVQVTPTGSNRFKKSEKCYFYAEIYEPAMAVPGVKEADVPAVGIRMELLDPQTGTVKKDLGLTRLRLPPVKGSPVVPIAMVLPVDQVDPGSYRLRITALDAKSQGAVRTIDFDLEN